MNKNYFTSENVNKKQNGDETVKGDISVPVFLFFPLPNHEQEPNVKLKK